MCQIRTNSSIILAVRTLCEHAVLTLTQICKVLNGVEIEITHSFAPVNFDYIVSVTWHLRIFVRLCYLGQTYF